MLENQLFPMRPEFAPVWEVMQTPKFLAFLLETLLPASQEAPLTASNIIPGSLVVIQETRGHFPTVEFSAWRGDTEVLECEVMLCTSDGKDYPLHTEAQQRFQAELHHRNANFFYKRSEAIKKTIHIWIQMDTPEYQIRSFGSGSFAVYELGVPASLEQALESEEQGRNGTALRVLREIADGKEFIG